MAKVTQRTPAASRSAENAREIAVSGLTYLAQDADALGAFLSLSGMDPADLRAAVADPAFLGAVLDFLCEDEARLVSFAASEGLTPAAVDRARETLVGRWERDSA